jgi:hypothetical protein
MLKTKPQRIAMRRYRNHPAETRAVAFAPHPVAECIDLRETFGPSFRYGYDPSYEAEAPQVRGRERAWLTIIPCQHGHVFPHGGRLLAASTDRVGGISRKLVAMDCCEVHQDGDDGVTVTFDVADFARVFAVMKPKRTRRLSAKARANLIEQGRRYRFDASSDGVQARKTGAERTQTHRAV